MIEIPNNQQINTDTELKLIWNCNVHENKRNYKNKDGSTNTTYFYKATFPAELIEAMGIENNEIFFYEEDNVIKITSTEPENIESKKIKIQKQYHHFSIPTQYFKVTKEDVLILSYDLLNKDVYSEKRGVLTITKKRDEIN